MSRHRTRGSTLLSFLAPLCLGILILLGWCLATAPGGVPHYFLPTPGAVWDELYDSLVVYADMWPYIGTTLTEALAGCLSGLVVAVPLAALIYRSRVASAALLPFLGPTQAIPAIALAPLLAVWVGYGLNAIVVLCSIMVFFPILVSTVVGLRHIDSDILDAAQLDGAGSVSMLVYIEFPLALHTMLAGVRNGFTLSVTGAVVGEMVMGGHGLGSLLTIQRDGFNMAGMFASVIVLACMATVIYSLVSLAERRWSNLAAPLPKGEA